jgi:hypothetical protein
MVRGAVRSLTLAVLCQATYAQIVDTYVGQVTSNSVLIAWGTTQGKDGENTIGRGSKPLGRAAVRIADRTLKAKRNWVQVTGLRPDTQYPYEVSIGGRRAGGGTVRTWPREATQLTFFVIGDYGDGSEAQRAMAGAMWNEFRRREGAGEPVRFVLTTGDNIYGDFNGAPGVPHSGSADADWEPKFFTPYRELLGQIPFLPSIGNHDGNASENRGDLATYLDNFFFPRNKPARWYEYHFGGLADFFALDSSENTTSGHPSPNYAPGGAESRWLTSAMAKSTAPWKIPYFHHPPFNAGPGHGASYDALQHWVNLFARSGVKVVFTGHEHNFQFSEDSDATGHVRYVISGSGGELRPANIMGNMARAHIAGWAPVRQFLVVEIAGRTMRITPVSTDPVEVRDAAGEAVSMPLVIRLP